MMKTNWSLLEEKKNEYLDKVGNYPDFNKLNMYCVAHFSSVIEGSSLTFRETWRLLDEGITPSRPEKHVSMVIDHFNALMYALRLAFQKEKLTLLHLEKINSFINRRTGEVGICPNTLTFYDTSEGVLRTYGAFTIRDDGSRKDYLHPHDVLYETKLMLDYVHKGLTNYSSFEKVNKLSFQAHYDMTRIHPFGEGNGRTARLVMNYIQYYHGYPLSFVLNRDRDSYYASLDATDNTSDLKHFETFMIKASLNAFRQGIVALKPSKEYKNPVYEK